MVLLEQTLPDLSANLALDEALLLEAEETGRELLRFWQWPTLAVVLGAGGKFADDVDEAACRADHVPVLRRGSGGGTVLLGPGCLLYSLILQYDRHPALLDVNASYRYILERMGEALAPLAPGVQQEGISDLTLAGKKFSGNAQHRKRRALVHHGTLLTSFDLALIGRYLKHPARQPDYRTQRPHADFLTNISAHTDMIRRQLQEAWKATPEEMKLPMDLVQRLVEEKYGQELWVRRR